MTNFEYEQIYLINKEQELVVLMNLYQVQILFQLYLNELLTKKIFY
jgi:hypothetical protein